MCGSPVLAFGSHGARDILYLEHVAVHGQDADTTQAREDWIRAVGLHLLRRAINAPAFRGFFCVTFRWVKDRRELETEEWREIDACRWS